jgi:hypothetical protein
MTREFPMISQFRKVSSRCKTLGSIGCAVATTEAMIRRYRPGVELPDQQDLGRSMGRRHRRAAPESAHGKCPSAWCPFCSYLELKAWNVPVAYGRLSVHRLRRRLARRKAVHIGGWYDAIHQVHPTSYDRETPARGRSDRSMDGEFLHSLVAWRVGEVKDDGTPRTYIVSDPDFASPARPRLPAFCEYDADELEAMLVRGGLHVAYCLTPPPPLDGPEPVAKAGGVAGSTTAVRFRFNARVPARERWEVGVPVARQRRSPFIRDANIVREIPEGTPFRAAQVTLSGTNVGGSTRWFGDASGKVWMHRSVLRPQA